MMNISILLDVLDGKTKYKKVDAMGTINNPPKPKRPAPPKGWTTGYQPKESSMPSIPSGGSSIKPVTPKEIGNLTSETLSMLKPLEKKMTLPGESSSFLIESKIVPSKIDKGKIADLLSEQDINQKERFIVSSMLASINFDDINSILNTTKSLNDTSKKILDTLLNNDLDSEKTSVLEDLSSIKKWMRSPSWFDSFFFGITIEDYLKKIDICVDNLIKKTNIVRKNIKIIDDQTEVVNEQLIQINARITGCGIILSLLENEYKTYREKYYDVISKLRNNLMISKQLMLKDPLIVKLSRDNLFNLIQSIEFDIFVLIHEWKVSLKLKKFKTDSDIKKMMSDIQKKITMEIGR